MTNLKDRTKEVADKALHEIIDAFHAARPGEPLCEIQLLLPRIHAAVAAAYELGMGEASRVLKKASCTTSGCQEVCDTECLMLRI